MPIPSSNATAARIDAPKGGARAAWRVLVVDDNMDAADTLALLLDLNGHVTRKAHDGVQALAIADEQPFDVVLLDIGLPLINGLEVARVLRQRPHGAQTVLIALTGWDQADDRLASLAAGFDAHLAKPCNHEVLLQMLPGLMAWRAASPPQAG